MRLKAAKYLYKPYFKNRGIRISETSIRLNQQNLAKICHLKYRGTRIRAVQTPVFSPPAPAPAKSGPAPAFKISSSGIRGKF